MKVSLFLHSTGTSPLLWGQVPDEVTAGTTVIAPTNLGYPPNEPLARGAPFTLQDDVANALRTIPAEATEIDVYAHSYGGLLALSLLPELEARVRSLFLYEPVVFGALATAGPDVDPVAVASAKEMLADRWLRDDEEGGTEVWLERFIDYWNKPGSWARMPEPIKEYTRSVGWKMYQEVRSVFFEVQSFDDVVLPPVPATLVVGERTTRESRAMTTALARRHPHARLVELPKGTHMTLLTHPQSVNPTLIEHLRAR